MNYSSKVIESNKNLTAKEQLILTELTDAVKLDSELDTGDLVIKPESYVVIQVHNEKASNKDYIVYIIQDENGTKYYTSSNSFWSAFENIKDVMNDNGETDWCIKCYKKPSKNYSGKMFITCSVI